MGCRYLLLPDAQAAQAVERSTEQLRRGGLQERACCPGTRLFASADTPTVRIPGGGTVVGHVFLDDGTPLTEASPFLTELQTANAARILLERCWGEYVLIQRAAGQPSSLQVMRDPSGGVACVHCASAHVSFVTSDVSIAASLGLYRRQVDWDFIAHFLAWPFVKTARTGLSGIRELLPGTRLHLHGSSVAVEQMWSPWAFVGRPRRFARIDDAATRLRSVVEDAVRTWAALDKAALVELSGGLDSSIVASCLRGSLASIHCLTVVPALPGADERLYAEPVARRIGVELHVEPLEVASAGFDDPVPPWAVVPGGGPLQGAVDRTMASVAAREALRCFYSGGGGDTVFGYLGGAAPAADAFRERGLLAALRAIRDLSDLHRCTFWLAARTTLQALAASRGQPPSASAELLDRAKVPEAPDTHPWWDASVDALPGDRERVDGLAATQLFRDTLPRGVRHWFRLPLLSQPVMETCLSIPSWMWVAGGRNRAVARLAFSDALPAPVLHRRSKGNFSQYNAAVYHRNKESMRRFLLEGRLRDQGLLDADALSAFFDRPLPPRDRSFMRIFDLCRAENWVRHQC